MRIPIAIAREISSSFVREHTNGKSPGRPGELRLAGQDGLAEIALFLLLGLYSCSEPKHFVCSSTALGVLLYFLCYSLQERHLLKCDGSGKGTFVSGEVRVWNLQESYAGNKAEYVAFELK